MFDELRKRIEEADGTLTRWEVVEVIDQLEAECGSYEAEIRNKAVDEFANTLISKIACDYEFVNFLRSSWSSDFACIRLKKYIDEITQQLKEG